MNSITHPRWIFLVNTFPVSLLAVKIIKDFSLINTLLSQESKQQWLFFASGLLIYALFHLTGGIIFLLKRKRVPLWFAVSGLCLSVSLLFWYVMHMSELIPFNVPQWMIPGDRYIYTGTFLMPTACWFLVHIVVSLTPVQNIKNGIVSFVCSLLIPLGFYLFFTVLAPSYTAINNRFLELSLLVLFICFSVLFLFLLLRSLYILIISRFQFSESPIWKLIISVVLPLTGLLVNNHFFTDSEGVFGNFSSQWFYFLTLVNGLILSLPRKGCNKYRGGLFLLTTATLPFTLYFFIVFLPYLPFAVPALIFFGTGFLVLAPAFLMVLHAYTFYNDFRWFKEQYSIKRVALLSLFSFLIIPLTLTGVFLSHRSTLHRALNYIYRPVYNETPPSINADALLQALDTTDNLDHTDTFLFKRELPYISNLYRQIVFDGLTLSRKKKRELRHVFGGISKKVHTIPEFTDRSVKISDIMINSTWDEEKEAWISKVDLELANTDNSNLSEYHTVLNLPEGCFISNYYLDVEGIRKYGILSEKKSAMWIYNQVRTRERRDPGILYYLSGNSVRFAVFPFRAYEKRNTGIEFIHKEPVVLNWDNREILLGKESEGIHHLSGKNGPFYYISSQEKSSLPRVKREPYYHFLVDTSLNARDTYGRYREKIQSLIDKNHISASGARVSFVNSSISTYAFDNEFQNLLQKQKFTGGFFLDRAIKETLFNSWYNMDSTYPIIVVVTEDMSRSVILDNFRDFSMAFPESPLFYRVLEKGELNVHLLTDNPGKKRDLKPEFHNQVLAWSFEGAVKSYIPDSEKPSVVILDKKSLKTAEINLNKDWQGALFLRGSWLLHNFYPSEESWRDNLRISFTTGIMTPLTSWIVVENEAQETALIRKQKSVLKGKEFMDTEAAPLEMSEPVVLPAILFFIFLLWKRKRTLKKTIY